MNRLLPARSWLLGVLALLLIGCSATATPGLPPVELEPSPTSAIVVLPTPTATPDSGAESPPVMIGTPDGSAPSPEAPTSPPPARPGEQRIEGGTLGTIWSLAGLRHGEHADRFRVVLELEEPGTTVPRYTAELANESTQPFPGVRDPDWGTVRIDLVVSDLYAYDYPLGERLPISVADNPVVNAITRFPIFDDALLGFSIWLDAPARFEVHELTEPVRLVVDVIYP